MLITVNHVRGAGMCLVPGARMFFKQNNLDWKDFLKNGIDSEIVMATGDAMAIKVVEFANGQQQKANDRL